MAPGRSEYFWAYLAQARDGRRLKRAEAGDNDMTLVSNQKSTLAISCFSAGFFLLKSFKGQDFGSFTKGLQSAESNLGI